MSSIDTSRFKNALLDERRRVVAALEHLRDDPNPDADDSRDEAVDQHYGDAATALHDREVDNGLEENERELLEGIDAALARIDQGTYGVCTNCGKPIGEERLEALPWASLCIDCARDRER